jgi:hypothetical protein
MTWCDQISTSSFFWNCAALGHTLPNIFAGGCHFGLLSYILDIFEHPFIYFQVLSHVLESFHIFENPFEYSRVLSNILESFRIFSSPFEYSPSPLKCSRILWRLYLFFVILSHSSSSFRILYHLFAFFIIFSSSSSSFRILRHLFAFFAIISHSLASSILSILCRLFAFFVVFSAPFFCRRGLQNDILIHTILYLQKNDRGELTLSSQLTLQTLNATHHSNKNKISHKIFSPKAGENRPITNDRENTYGHLRA